jgi:hypothetical protein
MKEFISNSEVTSKLLSALKVGQIFIIIKIFTNCY